MTITVSVYICSASTCICTKYHWYGLSHCLALQNQCWRQSECNTSVCWWVPPKYSQYLINHIIIRFGICTFHIQYFPLKLLKLIPRWRKGDSLSPANCTLYLNKQNFVWPLISCQPILQVKKPFPPRESRVPMRKKNFLLCCRFKSICSTLCHKGSLPAACWTCLSQSHFTLYYLGCGVLFLSKAGLPPSSCFAALLFLLTTDWCCCSLTPSTDACFLCCCYCWLLLVFVVRVCLCERVCLHACQSVVFFVSFDLLIELRL